MQMDVPPPGRPMPFAEWAAAIVAGVRRYLPDAKAARKGDRHVILRYGRQAAHLKDGGTACWITFASDSAATTMASMYDPRRDAFTVGNIAQSIAGYFDARFTLAQTKRTP